MRETARKVAEIDLLGFAHLGALRGLGEAAGGRLGRAGICAGAASGGESGGWRSSGGGRFVPNSVYMDAGLMKTGPAVLLITGPNMGGKRVRICGWRRCWW